MSVISLLDLWLSGWETHVTLIYWLYVTSCAYISAQAPFSIPTYEAFSSLLGAAGSNKIL